MEILYQNVNRIRSKTTETYLSILNFNYDIICFTETNFNESVSDSEVFDSRYNVFRGDRHSSSNLKHEGGGVVIAIKKTYNVTRQTSWETELEDLWITIMLKPNYKLNLCLSYLPPYASVENLKKYYENLQNVILKSNDEAEFLCIGDYNTPNVSWVPASNFSSLTPSPPVDRKSHLLIETISVCGLSQYNHISNKNNRLLDLVLSTTDAIVVNEGCPLSRMDSHHPALLIKVNLLTSQKVTSNKPFKRLNFKKCDIMEVRRELSETFWPSLLSSKDVNINVATFYEHLNCILAKHTPYSCKNHDNYPVWFNAAVKRCLNEKEKYHKLFKKFHNPRDYDVFSMLRARCKRLIKNCYKNFIASVENELCKNVKCFWSYVNSKRNLKDTIPHTMKYNSSEASDLKSICELFSQYFGSVFEKDNPGYYNPEDNLLKSNCSLSTIFISEDDILGKIKKLDVNKGAGPDGIPPYIIKHCAKELCHPLYFIFNQSLQTGVFPEVWKTAHIIPIFKSGDKSCCENYRPVSILSCLAKLHESVVYDVLYAHFQPLLSPNQHGFTKNKSTISNLLEYKNYLCGAFAKNTQVDSIYTDFSKAFDKVNHRILCKKLQLFGIHGSLLRWIESYLERRNQLVALKAELSAPICVTSGVPQGSHLGPLFFIVFINDLIENLSCPCLLYADDLKVFSVIKSIKDAESLQNDLNSITHWCKVNHMFLNVKKCAVVTFTRKVNKINFDYNINGQILQRLTQIKDLGVTFDEELSFKPHYNNIYSKASRLLGFTTRLTKEFKNARSAIYIFNSLVRSNLEYGSIIWSPFYAVHSKLIEGVQKKFMRSLAFRQGLSRQLRSYCDRLAKFNMTTLENRRKQSDLIYLYKIINSYIDSPSLLSSINFNTVYKTRNPNLFSLQVFRNNTSYYNPIVRMCRLYNEISHNYKELDIFENNLYSYKRKVLNAIK